MYKEEKECNIGGDSDSNVDLDCLDLFGRQHPGGHGHLAAVDCPEHGEEEQGEDHVDADLHTEPELGVKLHHGLEHLELDEDEAGDYGNRAGQGQKQGQSVQEGAENWASGGGGEKSKKIEALNRGARLKKMPI